MEDKKMNLNETELEKVSGGDLDDAEDTAVVNMETRSKVDSIVRKIKTEPDGPMF